MATPKPRVRNIADLKANILNPSLTSTYECHFNPPTSVRSWLNDRKNLNLGAGYDSILSDQITLSCREATLPGTSLATHTLDNDRTGVTERHAYRRQYSDVASFTFYVDNEYNLIHFFENWIAFIVNEGASDALDGNYNYRVNFPNEYKTDIFVKKFEKDYTGRNLDYRFINAYPISINEMPLSYDASTIMTCTVNFNFTRYVINS
tara:strand:+ start:282 stop:899 length:618 start_codon:yes stop_codon:yes gene_type:complete